MSFDLPFNIANDAIVRDGRTDENVASMAEPIVADGVMYIPAEQFFAVLHEPDDVPSAIALLSYCGFGPFGVATPLSVVQARELASGLIEMADKIETAAKVCADEALRAAAKKGGQS